MKRRCSKWIAGMLFGICLAGSISEELQAAEKLNVSSKEYSLAVEDAPQSVEGKVYAKLHDTSKKASMYQLSLFESYDAMIQMEDALENAGEKLTGIDYLAVEVVLYEGDEAGDYYPVETAEAATVICPVPEEFQKQSDKLQITSVSSAGELERISSKLVTVNGTECVQFDVFSEKTYAFLVKESGKLTSGTFLSATPTPKPQATATPTPAPTKKPEATPTPKPEATPKPEPTKPAGVAGESVQGNQTGAAASTPTKKPEPTPTKKPAAGNSVNSGTAVNSGQKDKTPQTGDDFSRENYIMLLVAGAGLCMGATVLYKKSSKSEKN